MAVLSSFMRTNRLQYVINMFPRLMFLHLRQVASWANPTEYEDVNELAAQILDHDDEPICKRGKTDTDKAGPEEEVESLQSSDSMEALFPDEVPEDIPLTADGIPDFDALTSSGRADENTVSFSYVGCHFIFVLFMSPKCLGGDAAPSTRTLRPQTSCVSIASTDVVEEVPLDATKPLDDTKSLEQLGDTKQLETECAKSSSSENSLSSSKGVPHVNASKGGQQREARLDSSAYTPNSRHAKLNIVYHCNY